jgi:hypothetical protein
MGLPVSPAERRRRPFWIAAASGIVALGVIAATLVAVPGLLLAVAFWIGSERTVFAREVSPDGWNEARVQFDDCGAPCSFDRIVLVKSRLNPSDEPLLSCRAFLAEGEANVRLRWLDDRTLLIQHAFPPDAIDAQASSCGPIRIVARSLPSP